MSRTSNTSVPSLVSCRDGGVMRSSRPSVQWHNTSVGLWVASILIIGCNDSTEPTREPTEPTRVLRMIPTAETSLMATVATEVTPTPAVRVMDQAGRPAGGVAVFFKVTGGGVKTS